MGHTKRGTASLQGSSTRKWPIYGRSQHLRVTATLALLAGWQPFHASRACNHLKPRKSPKFDLIFREFILYTGSALKSWLYDFFTSCMWQLKIPWICRRALIVVIPKLEKPLRDPKSYYPVCPLQDPQKNHLCSCCTNHQSITPIGTDKLSKREVSH